MAARASPEGRRGDRHLRHRWFADVQRARLKTDGQPHRSRLPGPGVERALLRAGRARELLGAGGVRPPRHAGRAARPHRRRRADPLHRALGPRSPGLLPDRGAGRRACPRRLRGDLGGEPLRGPSWTGAGDYRLVLKESGGAGSVRITEAQRSPATGWALSAPPGFRSRSSTWRARTAGWPSSSRALVRTRASTWPRPSTSIRSKRLISPPARRDTTRTVRSRGRVRAESGRVISDEYRYILDRREQDVFPGNMLRRPGYLLTPGPSVEPRTAWPTRPRGRALPGA